MREVIDFIVEETLLKQEEKSKMIINNNNQRAEKKKNPAKNYLQILKFIIVDQKKKNTWKL